jgi:hypothetical protein
VENDGKWDTQLPLVRVRPDRDEFALNKDGVVYSLAHAVTNSVHPGNHDHPIWQRHARQSQFPGNAVI